jgi:cysteine synthase
MEIGRLCGNQFHVHQADLAYSQAGLQPPTLDPAVVDEVVTVHTDDARVMTRRLALDEGIFVGVSSGAVVCAAIKVNLHSSSLICPSMSEIISIRNIGRERHTRVILPMNMHCNVAFQILS